MRYIVIILLHLSGFLFLVYFNFRGGKTNGTVNFIASVEKDLYFFFFSLLLFTDIPPGSLAVLQWIGKSRIRAPPRGNGGVHICRLNVGTTDSFEAQWLNWWGSLEKATVMCKWEWGQAACRGFGDCGLYLSSYMSLCDLFSSYAHRDSFLKIPYYIQSLGNIEVVRCPVFTAQGSLSMAVATRGLSCIIQDHV